MEQQSFVFSQREVTYLFGGSFSRFIKDFDATKVVIVTDENVFKIHQKLFEGLKTITVAAGEEHKTQQTVDGIIMSLLNLQADKNTILIAVGGGVITDMGGYAASIFKRGIRLALVPTTILAMVDASVGGKNGVDVGNFKNMVGTVYQPERILFDFSLLATLPEAEWINGFAEVIKHACIRDASMFKYLETLTLDDFMNDVDLIADLVVTNVNIKTEIVQKDEFETGDRKLLNFGHTLGHAIENLYKLPHGHAVSIGMVAACSISEDVNMFDSEAKARIINLLTKYHLPVKIDFDPEKVWEVLLMDKKRSNQDMNFVLLEKIGVGEIKAIPLVQLKGLLQQTI
jgi:3-dehydroquinate synthase